MSSGGRSLEVRITVLGAGSVGKSALTVRLVTGNFIENYDPTIEDSYRKHMNIDDKPVMMDILDTAGQEEFRSMSDNWMRQGEGFLLVYDITRENTYLEIKNTRQRLVQLHKDKEKIPMILVGSKIDLVEENLKQHKVKQADAKEIGANWNCKHIETSAKDGICSEDCFIELVRAVRKNKDNEPVSKKKWKCSIL